MIRSLKAAENQILDRIRDKIQEIVTAGNHGRLSNTGLLGIPGANAQAYNDFSQRFGQLPGRLQELRGADRIKVNTDLKPSMGADAPTGVVNGMTEAAVHLPEALVADFPAPTITERAITLMHELSHTIVEANDFPVKDFTYRRSWGQGYLTAPIGACNADNYAEAAAQIAEDLEGKANLYREKGKIEAQRQELRRAQVSPILGPALAWADIKINRAWLRSNDYDAFAKVTAGSMMWPKMVAGWANDAMMTGLLTIEAELRDNMGRIIGDRYGVLTTGLSAESIKTAGNIYNYMETLKGALKFRLTVSNVGAAITYIPAPPPAAGVLNVPRSLVTGDSSALGNRIIDALINALDYTDAADRGTADLNNRKRGVFDLLVHHDRPYEAGQVQAMQAVFQGIQSAVPPAQAAWDSAGIDLDLARVKGIAEWMYKMACEAEEAATSVPLRPHLATLDESLQPQITEAVQIGTPYKAPGAPALSVQQAATLKANFSAVIQELGPILGAVVPLNPAKAATYNAFMDSLNRFVQ